MPPPEHFVKRLIAVVLVCAAPACAGQIYGSLVSQGKPFAKAEIVITCAGEDTKGLSAEDGTFKIAVSKTGRCTFTLPAVAGRPSAMIFSQPKPAMYDFDLVKGAGGNYELRIR